MKTIFLDIDGVLYGAGDTKLVRGMATKKILDMLYKFHKENECHIVIVSTRRMFSYERKDIDVVFKKYNFSYLDYTRRLSVRALEIESYVKENNINEYVILDDIDQEYSSNPELNKHFIKIDSMYGLTEKDLIKARIILNNIFK